MIIIQGCNKPIQSRQIVDKTLSGNFASVNMWKGKICLSTGIILFSHADVRRDYNNQSSYQMSYTINESTRYHCQHKEGPTKRKDTYYKQESANTRVTSTGRRQNVYWQNCPLKKVRSFLLI